MRLLPLSLAWVAAVAWADVAFFETEPNNSPEHYQAIAGEVTLYGTLPSGDQDGFRWTVSDDDARKRWSFELHGVPEAEVTQVSVMQIEYGENGVDPIGSRTLFDMGTRDSTRPSIHAGMIFDPGDYVLGIAQAGSTVEAGAYRILIREDSLSVGKNPAAGDTAETAFAIRPGSSVTSFEPADSVWYRLSFDASDTADRWTIFVQAPVGRNLQASLRGADGRTLAESRVDDKGRLSFRDLAPPVGDWFLNLKTTTPGMIQSIVTEATGLYVAGQEGEPNDERRLANHIDFAQPLSGHIGDGDTEDMFFFTVGETDDASLYTLRLQSETPGKLTFCLKSSDWKDVQCRTGIPPLEMAGLSLHPGEWGIHLRRAKVQAYNITFTPQGPVEAGHETEPNDSVDYANSMPSRMLLKGRFSGDDTDIYQFMITGEAARWRFQANGDSIRSVSYLNGRGQEKASVNARKGSRLVRLDNLLLLPGRHYIEVRGNDGDYTVLARSLGPPVVSVQPASAAEESRNPDAATPMASPPQAVRTAYLWNPDVEVEPNDQYNMQRLAIGQTRTGTLPDNEDSDYYRLFVAGDDHLRLTITPPGDGTIVTSMYWYETRLGVSESGAPGEPTVLEGVFPPGDYTFSLKAGSASDKPYRMHLERLPRFSCPKDCEPNGMGDLDTAAELPADLVLEGIVGEWRDDDVYQLPAFSGDVEMIVHPEGESPEIWLRGPDGTLLAATAFDRELHGHRLVIPAGGAHQLLISGHGRSYRLALEFPGGQMQPVNGAIDGDMSLRLSAGEVAAFLDDGQQVAGTLIIRNSGAQAVSLDLQSASSDHRWATALDQQQVSVAAGAELMVALTIRVPSDAWADHPVRITVLARDSAGHQLESWADVQVVRDVAAVDPQPYFPIPESLRGGFNAAWLPLKAQWVADTPDKARAPQLRDGLAFPGHPVWCCGGQQPVWTLDLPGDDPLPVKGFSFDTLGNPNVLRSLRRATLMLSGDGQHFSEVLNVEALPLLTEQFFALPVAMNARFARLRIDGTFERPVGEVGMGEWKLILEPGFDLSGGQGFNIADPELGGHVVWVTPENGAASGVLDERDKPGWARLGRNRPVNYVIGFNRNRAAQIVQVEWQYHEATRDADRNFRTVTVYSSAESPIGPWQILGRMELVPADTGAKLDLETPSWARFVRFEAQPDPAAARAQEPDIIRIRERAGGDDYVSVLTEWGNAGSRAFYEIQQGGSRVDKLPGGNDSPERAAILKTGETAGGAVALGRLQNWFRVPVPPDINTLTFELTGDPTVRTVLESGDSAGDARQLKPVHSRSSARLHRYEAVVEPGQEVLVRVSEPPRNVVFSWDTSGSVGRYLPRIYNSVMAFSGEVQPGSEWVNLLPFGQGFLLRDWSDDALELQTVLNDYREDHPSSDAEKALDKAARGLAPRPGTKAVILVTDAVTPYYGALWEQMVRIQPRIFGIGVAGSGVEEQNRFRDWAAVNGGDYHQLRYLGEMDVAFDRASTRMRRPAGYTLKVAGEFREQPGPGTLTVLSGDSVSRTAVELILDASGSMLQRIGGKRRITMAREVLTEAVRSYIPAGTPVALRVFGHREADSCRTDLEIPLAPLNPDHAAETIAGINAMNLARTPIAESLAATLDDLKGAGSAAIVLVTDGEETCDGDPQAVIESLRGKGLEVSLNIVGFAIDDENLAEQFESWATAGGGSYFAANDQAGLSDALQGALGIPFKVYDLGGNTIATGQVGGESIEIEPGIYRVMVDTRPPGVFEEVEIRGESETLLEVGG